MSGPPGGKFLLAVLMLAIVWALVPFDGMPWDWIGETFYRPRAVPYTFAALVFLGGGIFIAFNFRRPVALSRRQGGNGLRLGQGPLPDQAAFEARIARLAGSAMRPLAYAGFWLLNFYALLVAMVGIPFLIWVYVIALAFAAVGTLATATHPIALLLLSSVAYLIVWLLFRRMPRAIAAGYLASRRIEGRWFYALQRLSPKGASAAVPARAKAPPEPVHDPGPPDLSPEAMDERWRKARRFGDF